MDSIPHSQCASCPVFLSVTLWIAVLRLTNNNPTFEKVYPSKGFGWYLSNSFVSIARSQMLESIIKLEIMTEEEVKEALEGGENARLRIDYANK